MQTHTPITLESVPVLSWEGLPRPRVERTKRWYVTTGIVVLIAAGYGIFTGSWSFAIVCVLAGGMYSLIHDHQPSPIRIELHDSGVLFNGDFVRWDQLHGFWFLRTRAYTELRFVPKTPRKRMAIQLGDQDIERLRMILGQRLPELKDKHEGILDTFIRICKL